MVTWRETWLELTKEAPIEPDLPICDTHHHLWQRPESRYLLEDFLHDIGGGHNIVQTVFVECRTNYKEGVPREMQPVGETEFVESITRLRRAEEQNGTKVAAGIVGFADLTLGAAVAPVLEAQLAAGKGRFRGIRHRAAWDANITPAAYAPKGLLLEPKFREGLACLRRYGLSFDAWVFHPQLMELVDLAKAFPDTPMILNHIGGPLGTGPYAGKHEDVFREWQRGMAALAACPGVFVKLGGLGMIPCGFGWHERSTPPGSVELAEAMAPYYLWCIDQFGVGRCMFESNFPVDKQSYSYTVLWNAFKRICADFSSGERRALFHDTAVKVYRL